MASVPSEEDSLQKEGGQSFSIPLIGCSVEYIVEESYQKRFCFEIANSETKTSTIISAESGTEMQEWMNIIRRAILKIRKSRTQSQVGANKSEIEPPSLQRDDDDKLNKYMDWLKESRKETRNDADAHLDDNDRVLHARLLYEDPQKNSFWECIYECCPWLR